MRGVASQRELWRWTSSHDQNCDISATNLLRSECPVDDQPAPRSRALRSRDQGSDSKQRLAAGRSRLHAALRFPQWRDRALGRSRVASRHRRLAVELPDRDQSGFCGDAVRRTPGAVKLGSCLTDATPRTAPGVPFVSSHCTEARTHAPVVNVARSPVASFSNALHVVQKHISARSRA